MADSRLQNSKQELAALHALIEDPAVRIELSVFRARYWQLIKNLHSAPEGLLIWRAEVDHSLLRYVDIVDGGKVVARVPPILAEYPSETKYHNSRAMSKISSDIEHCMDISPIAAEKLIDSVLPAHFSSIDKSDKMNITKQTIRDAWDSLYLFFNESPPFSKNNEKQPGKQSKPIANQLEVEGYDDW